MKRDSKGNAEALIPAIFMIAIMVILTLALAVIDISFAKGEITVPAETEVGKEIVATVAAEIPEGAEFKGGWEVTSKADCTTTFQELKLANSIGIWINKAGEHLVTFKGYWLLLGPTITVKDVNGDEQTFTPYLGSDKVDESESFKTTGGGVDPEPNPNPTPTPGQKHQVVMFHRAGEQLSMLPQGQRDLLTSLVLHKKLEGLGYEVIRILDDNAIKDGVPSKFVPWVSAVVNDPLPRWAMAPVEGGPIVDFPLPDDWDALMEKLGIEE